MINNVAHIIDKERSNINKVMPQVVVVTGADPHKFRNFRDIPIGIRQKAIKSELIKREMLSKLPLNMAQIFVEGFLNPTKEKLAVLKNFFALPETSIVTTHIINRKPSSHKALEPLYNKHPVKLVDKYFYDSPAGDAIPDRLETVVSNLPHWIRMLGLSKDTVKVLIPGSGPAQDIIRILSNNPDLGIKMKAVCVDNESSALETGRKLAQKAGVSDNIKYIEGDLMKLNYYREFDLALLVGIICPLQTRMSIKVINTVANYCRQEGFVVVSAALQKMLLDDPATCYVMDFIGWKIDYKTEDEFAEIIRRAGLIWITSFQDPKSRFHRIVIGKV
jgi:hypothetical protein